MNSLLQKYQKEIYYIKVILQYSLIGMLFYQSNLGLRDSDKQTFEYRVRESINFIEHNHPAYRYYMIMNLGIDRVNCTRD